MTTNCGLKDGVIHMHSERCYQGGRADALRETAEAPTSTPSNNLDHQTQERRMDEIEFQPWPKIARLNRDITITEKIDGTNAAVLILEDGMVAAQSRKRLITPDDDNFGFARWVAENAGALTDTLGAGRHFGEWWGSGIQRGYGLTKGEKRFSLFNTARYGDLPLGDVDGLATVPVLHQGPMSTGVVNSTLTLLDATGSKAAPGFMDPEGIIVFHSAAQQMFKVTIKGDEVPKSLAAAS